MKTRVAVCDSSRMRYLGLDTSPSGLVEIADLVHQQSRQRPQDIVSDKPGSNKGYGGFHGMGNSEKPARHEVEVFAKQVGNYLNDEVLNQGINRLFILSPPEFLGLLRKELHEQTQKAIVDEYKVNVAGRSLEEIRKHLPNVLQATPTQQP